MSRLRSLFPRAARALLAAWLVAAVPAQADAQTEPPRSALARIDPAASAIRDAGTGIEITLALSQPVPWRVFTLDAPRRLVIDLSEAIWPAQLPRTARLAGTVRMGAFRPGWSRLVLGLDAPLGVASAGLSTTDAAGAGRLTVRLDPVSPEAFAAAAGTPPEARMARPDPAAPAPVPPGDRRLRVTLDPGHGGIDPGAQAGGLTEADLMLTFARELREVLLRTGVFAVSLTRDRDEFVPLETRITRARNAGAQVFLSLHADALPADAGMASGATIYTLSDEASDLASQRLAERHDQADLLSGVDLAGQSDEIALVLMDLARRETEPRTARLARALVTEITASLGPMNSTPLRQAGFSVLKAPDIPSVLVELGFLSSPRDRGRLADPDWRHAFARAVRDALAAWAAEDRALRPAPG